MKGTGYHYVDRREFLVGALAGGVIAVLPGAAFAQAQAVDPATDAVRRLMVLSTQNALNRLSQPNGFLTSVVARIGLPMLFVKRGSVPMVAPLTDPAFRQQLTQRLNQFAEAGARGAIPAMAEAARKLPIPNASLVLNGKPTAATSMLRLEMGAGLVNALRTPIEQAMVAAQDPLVAQAISALPGVTLGDAAHAVALSADNGIWYEIGSAEAEIRANPAATNDPVLIAALSAPRPAVPQP